MTIEHSHGKRRLTSPRVSDMGEGAPHDQPADRSEQLRQNARFRGSKTVTRAALEAIVGAELGEAMPGAATQAESRMVAEHALQLASDAAREINVASPFVAHHTTRFGVNASLAGFYTQKAAERGFASAEGLTMLKAAHDCEARAERAMVAAEAAVKAFAGKRRKTIDLGQALADASRPRSSKP